MFPASFIRAAAVLYATNAILAAPSPSGPGLISSLKNAVTAVDRVALLPDDSQFVFDFFDPSLKAAKGAGGEVVLANSASFPAVVGNGAAMAVGILDACSMNTPHTHPRAAEVLFSVNQTIRSGMITENGAQFVLNEIPPGSMTVFPQGSVHFQVNDGCEPAFFVSGLNSEDPGALQVAQRLFGLSPDVVAATLGDIGVEEVEKLNYLIPDSVAIATDECLKRCHRQRPSQPTTQQQGRLPGNAFPSSHITASASGP